MLSSKNIDSSNLLPLYESTKDKNIIINICMFQCMYSKWVFIIRG